MFLYINKDKGLSGTFLNRMKGQQKLRLAFPKSIYIRNVALDFVIFNI